MGQFSLTPEERDKVARQNREMLSLPASDPIDLTVKTDDELNPADEVPFRLSLQPGARRNINGKTYVLNENHRWTLPE